MSTMKKRVSEAENFRTRSTYVQKEFDEAAQFFQNIGLRGVFLIFGSARSRSGAQIEEARKQINEKLSEPNIHPEVKASLERQLLSWKRKEWMAPVWDATAELSKLLTQWSISPEGVTIGNQVWSLLPGGNEQQPLQVCTGGGPGFMEAGNYGASQVPGSKSIGVAVKLPFETDLNPFLDPDHGITVNSFYARKYWEVYAVKAMICCPGGFGTLDEMFEVLTLVQCGHCPKVPIVLLGKEFWTNAINFKFLAEKEVIAQADVDQLCITDSPEEAFKFIVDALREEADRMASMPTSPKIERILDSNGNSNQGAPAPLPPFRREREEKEQESNPTRGATGNNNDDAAQQ